MLTHPILDQLAKLGLTGMAQAFAELDASGDAATLTHADWLGLLVDREMTHRRDKRLAARLRYARLRHNAVVEDVDYRVHRGLDRALFYKLAGGEYAQDNLILCGPTGVGKSWLACALGHKACRDNRSVLYQRVPKLFAETRAGLHGDGRYVRIICAASTAPSSSPSTIGVSTPSTPAPAVTSRSSSKKNATAAMQGLAAHNPESEESRLAIAETALAARSRARRVITSGLRSPHLDAVGLWGPAFTAADFSHQRERSATQAEIGFCFLVAESTRTSWPDRSGPPRCAKRSANALRGSY